MTPSAAKTQKTLPESTSPRELLSALEPESRREDALAALEIMEAATGVPAEVWTGAIIGCGRLHYRYPSGHTGVSARVGFAARAKELVFYSLQSDPAGAELLARLGPHRAGKGCVYIRSLTAVDTVVLGELIARAYNFTPESEIPA